MNFIKLNGARTGKPIFINLDDIKTMEAGCNDDSETIISFKSDGYFTAAHPLSKIMKKIHSLNTSTILVVGE